MCKVRDESDAEQRFDQTAGTVSRGDFTRAVDGRTVIGQAQGILMERYGITAEQAFTVLKRLSQDGNVKLHQLASEFVEHRRFP